MPGMVMAIIGTIITATAITITAITIMVTMITRLTVMPIIMAMTITITIITTSTAATIMLMITGTKPDKASRRRKGAAIAQSGDLGQPAGPVSAADDRATLYRLMTWLSPSFPVGAFAYSSGLEWAVEAGDITDSTTLREWLASMLADGSGFCDAVFLAQTHRALTAGNAAALTDVAELAAVMVPSRERQLETTTQGRAFMDIARAAWSCAALEQAVAGVGPAPVYPVAVGLVSAAHGIALPLTVHAFLHALTANWISAAARLVPLGQTDSQRTLAALEDIVGATGRRALEATLDDLGSATFRADLASMRHEAQYTRLFRS